MMAVGAARTREIPLRHALAVTPLLGLILLLLGALALPPVDIKTDSGYEMMRIGENLARGGSFGNPFIVLDTGPTATQPPLYPLFLAFCYKLFRDYSVAWLAIRVANVFAGAATVVVLHSLVRRLLGKRAAHCSAALWIASAWMGSSAIWGAWDAGFTSLVLVAFCHATLAPARGWFVAGTLLGALFLLNPAAVIIAAAWWAYRRIPARQSVGILLVAAAVGAPWMIRNYMIWGRIIIRANFGSSFFSSNNSCAEPHMIPTLQKKCYEETHPNESRTEAELVRRLGEPEYDRIRTAAALDWIRANPGRFANLTAWRVWFFWFPPPVELSFQSYSTWVVTLLSIPGLLWMWRRRAQATVFVAAATMLYPALYCFVISAAIRYREPFAWVAVIPAAYFCDRLAELAERARRVAD